MEINIGISTDIGKTSEMFKEKSHTSSESRT